MNLMSIDPSKRSLGLYINLPGYSDISLVIKSKKDEPDNLVYKRISETIKYLISFHQINLIFIEDYALSRFGKSKSVSTMAEITGIIKGIVAESNICKGIIKVPISTWKASFKGLPKYKNKKYIEMVNKLYNKLFKTSDEADAYLIMVAMYLIWQGFVKSDTQIRLRNEMLKYGEVWAPKIIKPKDKIIQ